MQFGLQVNPYHAGATGNPWDLLARLAPVADASAFDSLWLYDHFLYEGGYSGHPVPEPVLECFTALGALAATTKRIRLGQLVLGVPYRNPALTAKMATTLDLISHGRSILGLGAGWHRREYEAYGWGAFESVGVRMQRLEEALQVVRALWTEQPAQFSGKHYRLEGVQENPRPLQQPHPPILVGGSGERVTLRLVAEYAQYCNVSGDPATVARLFDRLREHCALVGRPYDAITRSVFATVVVGQDEAEAAAKRARWADYLPGSGAIVGAPDQVAERLREYAAIGCQYVIVRMPDWAEGDAIQLFSERVIPPLA